MILKKRLSIILLFIGIITVSAQKNVCTSSNNEYQDLNTIGKCAIENFKKSKRKEFIQVSSRNRYVRKKPNTHLANFKRNIKAVSSYNKPKKIISKVVTKEKVSESKDVNVTKNSNLNKETFIKDYFRFDQVSKAPIFITCDSTTDDIKAECNKETISGIILENFTYPFDAAAEGISGKVWVRFVIDKDGYVTNVTTKGPENGALLEAEAERLVKLLPKFMPGKQNDEYVNVEYFMPIEFHLDEE